MVLMERLMRLAERDQILHNLEQLQICLQLMPVQPSGLIVLTVRIVIAVLTVSNSSPAIISGVP